MCVSRQAAPVNRLVPQTEREKQLFELGESAFNTQMPSVTTIFAACVRAGVRIVLTHVVACLCAYTENKLMRKELAKASLFTQPPTPEEQKLLHTIFMDRVAGKQVTGTHHACAFVRVVQGR
jgi:hypothetical protein